MVAAATPTPPPVEPSLPQSTIRNPHSAIPSIPQSPIQPDQLIKELADPTQTLGDVAYLHDLSLEQLTRWIAQPDTTERLKALTDSIYLRTRLAAINHLATAVSALNTMIGAYIEEERRTPVNSTSIQDRDQRRRSRETARKAINLLTRLAHLPSQRREHAANPRRRAQIPFPLGEVRGGVAEFTTQTPASDSHPTDTRAPTPTPITPRILHDRAGQAPTATLSLFSLSSPTLTPITGYQSPSPGRANDGAPECGTVPSEEPAPSPFAPRLRVDGRTPYPSIRRFR
jgi:hypothetical protein